MHTQGQNKGEEERCSEKDELNGKIGSQWT